MHRIVLAVAAGVLLGTTLAAAQTTSVTGVRVLSGTRPNVLGVIQGNALNSTNGPLADAILRLRDARTGRIIGRQISDRGGLFTFKGVEPGSYVVEIVTPDQKTLAASEMLNVNGGERLSALVRLPLRVPAASGVLGHTAPSLLAVAAAAGAAQILAVTATTSVTP
ncbi:MAG TPA: SpaA isopeptide-forming pilin-related protein [Vicinamibacterales bacterium]